MNTQSMKNLIRNLKIKYNSETIAECITLIDNNAHLFDYIKLEASLDHYHPMTEIWKFHEDISFHIMRTYRLPLYYLLCQLDANHINDEYTVIILSMYMEIYTDKTIFEEYNSFDMENSLLDIFADQGKAKSVQYLLDLGITRYVCIMKQYSILIRNGFLLVLIILQRKKLYVINLYLSK